MLVYKDISCLTLQEIKKKAADTIPVVSSARNITVTKVFTCYCTKLFNCSLWWLPTFGIWSHSSKWRIYLIYTKCLVAIGLKSTHLVHHDTNFFTHHRWYLPWITYIPRVKTGRKLNWTHHSHVGKEISVCVRAKHLIEEPTDHSFGPMNRFMKIVHCRRFGVLMTIHYLYRRGC